ncbi:MAG TPA: NADH-quinone oxidoreductase subunit L [Prolixibacteraceae bacterium]|nr:NADH-quinone oxidoreductase subunit L [Prolixibacteraceae bacterium]
MVTDSYLKALVWLVPLLPLAGFLITGLGRKRLKGHIAGILASTAVVISFVLSVILFFSLRKPGTEPLTVTLFSWITTGELSVPFAFLIDPLSLTMMLIVTGVGALIHIYSIGYMHHDERVNTFFAQMNLFTFSMLLLVMGSGYLLLFIGWEGVGLCSYLLIGFWFKNPDYNYAARKAFVMNRIGDLGFLLGIILMFFTFHSLSFSEVFGKAATFDKGAPVITAITLLLLVGAVGKSAQIPLFTWLPDAMAGPTPVSALIHAATMVTAGIYMIARSGVLFNLAPVTLTVIMVLGLATAILAAIIALKQNDIKKVLAYSTVSQLGYMFLALGLGAYSAAVFHVTTHAFFKALLFLGAGSVIHAMGGEQDITRMGGLKTKLPVTFLTFAIAALAISGIPPFSGFFSKDLILAKAFEHNLVLYVFALGGALLTCFYMFRLLFVVFFGNLRSPEVHPHESPRIMTIPLMILAVLATVGGFLNMPSLLGGHSGFLAFLQPSTQSLETGELAHSTEWGLIFLSLALLGTVLWIAWRKFLKQKHIPEKDDHTLNLAGKIVYQKLYIDQIYAFLLEKPYSWLSSFLFRKVENQLLDPLVDGVGHLTSELGTLTRRFQRGNLSFYLFAMVAGILLFIVFILFV